MDPAHDNGELTDAGKRSLWQLFSQTDFNQLEDKTYVVYQRRRNLNRNDKMEARKVVITAGDIAAAENDLARNAAVEALARTLENLTGKYRSDYPDLFPQEQ
mmetsp:Transcript_6814/g.7828  ORF Transcript_6814/g.7828 Transcript_6814/m.7828 type:complete len:102 (+) Transcript_6814:145-450(+)|eukprot:CAMPEP_0184043486 /NCGR_PEP_ID=MMETSP0955-20130417/66946_1 /TAXON_ID=627963 /ORGANISM="Aplanochytrium sp, Strain PBS07" /LENGTH=101 /DNA_ID=CAMNT_0026334399 /DNA_START=428 /DNA_END=736 /DNA_ORIENTATION=+